MRRPASRAPAQNPRVAGQRASGVPRVIAEGAAAVEERQQPSRATRCMLAADPQPEILPVVGSSVALFVQRYQCIEAVPARLPTTGVPDESATALPALHAANRGGGAIHRHVLADARPEAIRSPRRPPTGLTTTTNKEVRR